MRSILLFIITISIVAVTNMPSDVSAASITIGGREWRKFTDTDDLFTHADLATIYDTKTGQLGATTTLKGIDFTGWTWGNNADAVMLAKAFDPGISPSPVVSGMYVDSIYNSTEAPAFVDALGTTTYHPQANARSSMAISRDLNAKGEVGGIEVLDWARPYAWDKIVAGNRSFASHWAFMGVLLYRTAGTTPKPVPEPTTIALLGIGLVGMAGAEVRRRRKKKTVDISESGMKI